MIGFVFATLKRAGQVFFAMNHRIRYIAYDDDFCRLTSFSANGFFSSGVAIRTFMIDSWGLAGSKEL